MEFKPLLAPGFHDFPLDGLKESLAALCVSPFENPERRTLLLERFCALMNRIGNAGLFTEIWIDGSFVTNKEEPEDIDLVLWYDSPTSISPRELQIYREVQNYDFMKSRFQCDVYVVSADNHHLRRYWREWFGKTRHGHLKGFIRVFL
jgi:hypothetical protein